MVSDKTLFAYTNLWGRYFLVIILPPFTSMRTDVNSERHNARWEKKKGQAYNHNWKSTYPMLQCRRTSEWAGAVEEWVGEKKGLFARQSIIIINGLKGCLVALVVCGLLRYDYDDDDDVHSAREKSLLRLCVHWSTDAHVAALLLWAFEAFVKLWRAT